jgi:hypothetical protein
MRKTLLALSALAAVAITASAASRTDASPLVNPAGLSGAVDDLAIVDNVHCRPGWRHHNPNNWRRADGCVRSGRSGVIVVPGRTRYVVRDGVRVRVRGDDGARTTVRSGGDRTTIRSRTNINVREGARREGRGDVNVRGGTRDGGGSVNVRGGTREGGGAATQGRGGVQKGSGGVQKGSGGVQKGDGGMQKGGGGGQN